MWVRLCQGIRDNIIGHGQVSVNMKLNIVMKLWFSVRPGQHRKNGTLGNPAIICSELYGHLITMLFYYDLFYLFHVSCVLLGRIQGHREDVHNEGSYQSPE